MFTLDNPNPSNFFTGDEVFVHRYASYGIIIRCNLNGYVEVRLDDGRKVKLPAHKVVHA